MELNKYKNIYFIGIGGSGMSALANYFVLENKNVSGYDKSTSVNTNNLESKGVGVIYNDRLMDLDKEYNHCDCCSSDCNCSSCDCGDVDNCVSCDCCETDCTTDSEHCLCN